MKLPSRVRNSTTRQAQLDKAEEREKWYKLVVKVIGWREGTGTDKITKREWGFYRQKMIKTNSAGREKALSRLKETWQKIKEHGGFV